MTKDNFTEKISLWLDNELSPTEVAELQAHLADCPVCHQTYQAMQQVDHLFRMVAKQMVAPSPGFTQRFETRLAGHRVAKPWQIWLTLGALLLGTLFLFGLAGLLGGLTLVSVSVSVINVGWFYQWLVTFMESVDTLCFFLNVGALFLKASFLTMQQPIFWGCLLIGIIITWLWARLMRALAQRSAPIVNLIF